MKSYNTVFDVKKEDIGTLNTYFLVLFLELKLVSAARPQIKFAQVAIVSGLQLEGLTLPEAQAILEEMLG